MCQSVIEGRTKGESQSDHTLGHVSSNLNHPIHEIEKYQPSFEEVVQSDHRYGNGLI
jgi:hypothetical protein